jgi:hypothetical protein
LIVAIETAHNDKMVLINFWEVLMRGFITLRCEKPKKLEVEPLANLFEVEPPA